MSMCILTRSLMEEMLDFYIMMIVFFCLINMVNLYEQICISYLFYLEILSHNTQKRFSKDFLFVAILGLGISKYQRWPLKKCLTGKHLLVWNKLNVSSINCSLNIPKEYLKLVRVFVCTLKVEADGQREKYNFSISFMFFFFLSINLSLWSFVFS